MKKLLFYFISLIFLMSIHQKGFSQRHRTEWNGPWGVGAGFGTTSYIGDLNEHNDNRFLIIPQSLSFTGTGWFSKGFGPITLILQMNLGRLQSRDYTKDQKFRANFYDYGGKVQLNLNQLLLGRKYTKDRWNAYIQGGVGLMRYSSYLTDMNNDELIAQVGYAAIGKAFSISGGAGVIYYMTDEANLIIGVDYSILNQDDVDAKIIGSSNDHYMFMKIGFSYTLSNGYSSGRGRRRSLLWGKF